ncbi:DNA cytosine methyltransferase [Burkholderia gladioli]|uniref:DNA cytosine methyltransferase n=1 Tax=Burkholderia gladioli TaxID=28095 RepID=UPI001640A485|nr:DNA cytosine methyltransferase [Burkholderia gladioli]
MSAYYNEIDPYAAQWLRNLIAAGHIAPGDVDERSIEDVRPDDLRGYTQCHFFAGLGGWSRALRLAGWPDDRLVWTGSCPCQPFSVAGKGLGFDDPRHLWPHWYWLIKQRRPATIFGEQVAAATDWLGLVRNNLEALEYAVGAMPIEAASAGAEHFRDRYWFVADSPSERGNWTASGSKSSGVAIVARARARTLSDCDNAERRSDAPGWNINVGAKTGRLEGSGDASERVDSHVVNDPGLGWGEGWTESEFRSRGVAAAVASIDGCQYVECPDGKWRRLPPPRVRWLGNGIPARVAKLRALGNAIDPRPAATFIKAYDDLI